MSATAFSGCRLQVRNSSSWYRLHDDGRVVLVVLRRNWEMGGYFKLEAEGGSVAEAEAAYLDMCDERGEQQKRQGERRANWGPRELQT